MATTLLKSKLYAPFIRSELVARPRLIEALNQGLERKLTLVAAPAGYGKTTLVAGWAKDLKRPLTWLSLGNHDNDALRFLTYLVGAFQRLDEKIGKTVESALQSARPPAPDMLLSALFDDIAAYQEPFVLVLDDYHLIDQREVHNTVASLLEHLHPQMHLVIVTRREPPLPLSRMRVRGQMTEVRASELQFSTGEAGAFLNEIMGLNLTWDEVERLASRTEGWIAGLLLSAHSLQNVVDRKEFIQAFAGDDRYVMDYLLDEVLDRLPEERHEFLLKTSILDRMCAGLCQTLVTGNGSTNWSQQTLEWLENANLFTIPLDNRRKWYRYHHLFAELLRYRLRMQQANELAELHQRASEWYVNEGFITEAIQHARLGEDEERVIELIEDHSMREIARGQLYHVKGWLKSLPQEIIQSRPYINVLIAWTKLLTHLSYPPAEVEERLEQAETLLNTGPQPSNAEERAQHEEIEVHIATARSLLAFFQGEDARHVIRLSRHAISQLDMDETFFRSILLLTLALSFLVMNEMESADIHWIEARRLALASDLHYVAVSSSYYQAIVEIRRGRLSAAELVCNDALNNFPSRGDHAYPVDGVLYLLLGTIALERGELVKAGHHLLQARDLLRFTGELEILAIISAELTRIFRVNGDWASALEALDQIDFVAPLDIAYVSALRALHWVRLGEHDSEQRKLALDWLNTMPEALDNEGEIPIGLHQHEMQYAILIIRARVEIEKARGSPSPHREELMGPILRFLEKQIQLAIERGWHDREIELALLLARALDALEDSKGALNALQQALRLGEHEKYVHRFVEEGATIGKLLHQVAAQGLMVDYIGRILAAFPDSAPTSSAGMKSGPEEVAMVEPLTERELEVLSLIAEGLPNKEIGQRLFLSLNTIKGHARNIYGKLGVKNRVQAATKARLMGLLSSK